MKLPVPGVYSPAAALPWRARATPSLARARRAPASFSRSEERAAAPSAYVGDGRGVVRLQAGDAVVTSSLTTTGRAEQVASNVLSIAHWERILEGELYDLRAATAVIDDARALGASILRYRLVLRRHHDRAEDLPF